MQFNEEVLKAAACALVFALAATGQFWAPSLAPAVCAVLRSIPTTTEAICLRSVTTGPIRP